MVVNYHSHMLWILELTTTSEVTDLRMQLVQEIEGLRDRLQDLENENEGIKGRLDLLESPRAATEKKRPTGLSITVPALRTNLIATSSSALVRYYSN